MFSPGFQCIFQKVSALAGKINSSIAMHKHKTMILFMIFTPTIPDEQQSVFFLHCDLLFLMKRKIQIQSF